MLVRADLWVVAVLVWPRMASTQSWPVSVCHRVSICSATSTLPRCHLIDCARVCCKTCVKAARICLLTVAEVPTIQANSFAFFLPQSLQISSNIHQSPNSPTKIHHTADRLSRSGNRVAWWRRYFGPLRLRPELVSEKLLNEFILVNPTLDLSSIIYLSA